MGKQLEVRVLIVFSKVLYLASPVFKVMIRSMFKCSIELAEKEESLETYGLPLPEYDAGTTIIPCRILYFNVNDIPEKPTIKQ